MRKGGEEIEEEEKPLEVILSLNSKKFRFMILISLCSYQRPAERQGEGW